MEPKGLTLGLSVQQIQPSLDLTLDASRGSATRHRKLTLIELWRDVQGRFYRRLGLC